MPKQPDLDASFEVIPEEATYWWRTNQVVGAILYQLTLLFIFVPIVLVYYRYYIASFLVFVLIVPYGFVLRRLAERRVTHVIRKHPETIEHFEQEGVIVR